MAGNWRDIAGEALDANNLFIPMTFDPAHSDYHWIQLAKRLLGNGMSNKETIAMLRERNLSYSKARMALMYALEGYGE